MGIRWRGFLGASSATERGNGCGGVGLLCQFMSELCLKACNTSLHSLPLACVSGFMHKRVCVSASVWVCVYESIWRAAFVFVSFIINCIAYAPMDLNCGLPSFFFVRFLFSLNSPALLPPLSSLLGGNPCRIQRRVDREGILCFFLVEIVMLCVIIGSNRAQTCLHTHTHIQFISIKVTFN